MKIIARVLVLSLLVTNNGLAASFVWDPPPYFSGNSNVVAHSSSSTHVEETTYANGTTERRESRSTTDFTIDDLRNHAASRPPPRTNKKHEEEVEVVKPKLKKKVSEEVEEECSGCDECRPKPARVYPAPQPAMKTKKIRDDGYIYHTNPEMLGKGERGTVPFIKHLPNAQCSDHLNDGFAPNGMWQCLAKAFFARLNLPPRYWSQFHWTAKDVQSASRRLRNGMIAAGLLGLAGAAVSTSGAKSVAGANSDSSSRVDITNAPTGTTGSGVGPGATGPGPLP